MQAIFRCLVPTVAALLGALFILCSQAPVASTGGSGTGVGNGAIIGKAIYSNKQPVKNGIVRLRTLTYLADTSGKTPTWTNDTLASVNTDSTGMFCIHGIGTGKTYYVEVDDQKSSPQGTLYKLQLSDQDTVLQTRVVEPTKKLTGTVKISGLPQNAYVLIYGLERVSRTDSKGNFSISELPIGKCEQGECEYKLCILVKQSNGTFKVIKTEMEVNFNTAGKVVSVDLELNDD